MLGIELRFLKLPVHSHFQGSRTTKVITAMFAETLGKRHGLNPRHASRHRRSSAEVSGQEISCSSSFIFQVLFVCKTTPLAGRTWFKVDNARIRSYSVSVQWNIIVQIARGLRRGYVRGGTVAK
jgi:hypothetical protein